MKRSVLNASDQVRTSNERVRFEKFDALAERVHDLSENAHVLVRMFGGDGGEGAMGVGYVTG